MVPRSVDPKGLRPIMRAIADTGFLLALVRSRDLHHAWALDVADQVTEPLLTCQSVLSETTFHLGDAALVLEMLQEQFLRLAFDRDEHLVQLPPWPSVTKSASQTWPTIA